MATVLAAISAAAGAEDAIHSAARDVAEAAVMDAIEAEGLHIVRPTSRPSPFLRWALARQATFVASSRATSQLAIESMRRSCATFKTDSWACCQVLKQPRSFSIAFMF